MLLIKYASALTLMATGQVDAPVGGEEAGQSLWEYALMGGPMMIPIGLCSVVALTIFVERMVSLRRNTIMPKSLVNDLHDKLEGDSADHDAAVALCEKDGSPLSAILAVGIKRIQEPIELLEKHVAEAGERAVMRLRKHLRFLAVIASVAPLMGLLGTIFGMINAFQTVAVSGEALGKTELLAKGIYQAMITTAGGLLVAIPVLLAYHWLSAKIEYLVNEMDQVTVDFLERHIAPPECPAVELSVASLGLKDGNGESKFEVASESRC